MVNDTRVLPARLPRADRGARSGRPRSCCCSDLGRPAARSDRARPCAAGPALSGRARRSSWPTARPGRRDRPGGAGAGPRRLDGAGPVEAFLEAHGLPPLPPYIRRYRKPGRRGLGALPDRLRRPATAPWPRRRRAFTSPRRCWRPSPAGASMVHRLTLHVGPGNLPAGPGRAGCRSPGGGGVVRGLRGRGGGRHPGARARGSPRGGGGDDDRPGARDRRRAG